MSREHSLDGIALTSNHLDVIIALMLRLSGDGQWVAVVGGTE